MNAIDWFYAKGDKHFGPVNAGELKRMATAGELKPDDLVWREGMAEWTIARNVRGLFEEEVKPAGRQNAGNAAGQAPGAPPKVVEPAAVASPAPAATPSVLTPAAAQVQPAQASSKHLFDLLLDLVRKQFSAGFVETTSKQFVTFGKFGLYAAMALSLVFALLMAIKVHNYELLFQGIIYFVILAVLQYVGVRFCDVLERLNRSTGANVSSTAFLDCFALLSIAIGVTSLIGSLVPAILAKEFWWIIPGLAGFIVSQYLAFIALNPSTINVNLVPESRAGEEALGLISFLVKSLAKLVPVIFGSFAAVGSLLLLYASVEIFTSESMIAELNALNAWYILVRSAALPFVAFLIFLLIFLLLDLCRAILVLPSKIEKSQNQETKP
jgi:hypothetical protein